MKYKLILLDIDGTLFNSKHVITDETKRALLKAQESGLRLIIASGRPENGLHKIADSLDMEDNNGILISYNGAMVSDYETKEIIYEKRMSKEDARDVLTHLKKFEGLRAIVDKDEYMYVEDVYNCYLDLEDGKFNIIQHESRGNGFMLKEVENLADFIDFPVAKILTAGNPEYLQDNFKLMREPFEGKLSSMFTAPFYYEYTAKDVDKSEALKASVEKLGYSSDEMIAFGDGENDITMVDYAGCGVAMGNAIDSLKEVSDYITLSNDQDGIAYALKNILPELY